MSDWQKGDLAIYVLSARSKKEGGKYASGSPRMRKGGIYVVEAVIDWFGVCGLVIDGHYSAAPHRAWHHSAFRKVPPHQADEFDRETIELLTGAPVRETASA